MQNRASSGSSQPIPLASTYVVVSLIHVTALGMGWQWLATATKPLLMLVLVGGVLAALRWRLRRPAGLLVAALLLSWAGDCAGLVLPDAATLPVMLLCFGAAHGCFMVLFWRHLRLRRPPKAALLLIGWWIGMLALVGPASGNLLLPLAGYGLLLAGTTTAALRCRRVICWGGVLFLVSDSCLAMQLFLDTPAWTDPVVMLTYTAAQGLMAWGAVRHFDQGSR